MIAASPGEKEVVRYLLWLGAAPNKTNDKGKRALDFARDESMSALLREEAPLLTEEETDACAEAWLATVPAKRPDLQDRAKNHVEWFRNGIKSLKNSYANMGNLVGNMLAALDSVGGLPPAAEGCRLVPPEALRWLLEHGADPMLKDRYGKTALDYATGEKKRAILKAAMEKAQK